MDGLLVYRQYLENIRGSIKNFKLPELESGDYVQYITQSNFVVQYRILQKQALEFEEVDEDGEPLNEDRTEKDGEPTVSESAENPQTEIAEKV